MSCSHAVIADTVILKGYCIETLKSHYILSDTIKLAVAVYTCMYTFTPPTLDMYALSLTHIQSPSHSHLMY